jgi:hypothetical protein
MSMLRGDAPDTPKHSTFRAKWSVYQIIAYAVKRGLRGMLKRRAGNQIEIHMTVGNDEIRMTTGESNPEFPMGEGRNETPRPSAVS